MKRLHSKLTYANVISSLALFLVLAGGTAFAASQFGKETIPGRAIKKESIGPGKLSQGAKSTLQGPKGATGPQGLQGPQGLPGAPGATKIDVQYGPEQDGSLASCPAGQVAVGGGGQAFEGAQGEGFLYVSQPMTGNALTPKGGTPNGWFVKGANEFGEHPEAIAYVLCASP
jgi:hypothetical protein